MSGCSTAVEHKHRDIEVMGSNPSGCWAYPLLYIVCSVYLIESLMKVPQLY